MKNRAERRDTRQGTSFASKLCQGLLVCTGLTSVPLFAQEAPPTESSAQDAPPAEDSQQLQEIVVTAQRREEKIQDIPISISAFNAKSLQERGVATVSDLRQVVPSLNFSGNVGAVYPFLRGIGNIAGGAPGNESSVAVYLDDVYYTRLSPAYLSLGNIDRVEVLKGPQGTLFGRNSSGGAIQMFTRDPGRNPEVRATLGYASYRTVSGNIYASTPITDTLAWNIAAGGSNQAEGWGENILTGEDVYQQKHMTIRSKLLWEPSDSTRVKLIGYYAKTNGNIGNAGSVARGTNVAYPNFGPAPPPGYPVAPALFPSPSNSRSSFYDVALNGRHGTRESGYGASLRIDQELAFADFVSISAFRKSKGRFKSDIDFLPVNFSNVVFNIVDNDISQEFQVKSKQGSRINWIVGAYYLYNKGGLPSLTLEGDLLNFGVAPGTFIRDVGIQKFNSYAAFAQATAPISGTANLTLGLRYTKDDLRGAGTQDLIIPGVGTIPLPGAITPFRSTESDDALTYRVAVDNHFTENVMGFASISRGYKSGTFNTVGLQAPANRPEIIDAYELGLKTAFFNRRVTVNGALFWNEIKDPQVNVFLVVNGVPTAGLVNAKGARTRGAELEVEALAAEGLTLRGAMSYLDAEYTNFKNAPFYRVIGGAVTGPFEGDASGNRLPLAPKWNFSGGVNYRLDSSMGLLVADANVSYKSKFFWLPDNAISQKPVTLVDSSLSFTPASLDWMTLRVYGKNLTNRRYYTLVQAQVFSLGNSEYQAAPAAPRTFGGAVELRF